MTVDEARIAELKAKVETEIGDLRRDIRALGAQIREAEMYINGSFATQLRAEKSKLFNRLDECQIIYSQCFPPSDYVLWNLERLYKEWPLH